MKKNGLRDAIKLAKSIPQLNDEIITVNYLQYNMYMPHGLFVIEVRSLD